MRDENLPESWERPLIETCCELNPRLDKSATADTEDVHFVPMAAVEALSNRVDVSVIRPFGEVKKGYTPFAAGDVIFAKITPCMENGKIAVVPFLQHDLAFGSTEFHVIRPQGELSPLWFFYFLSARSYRWNAEHNMTGAVGQKRVPIAFIARSPIPLPPFKEQKRIVAKIEELFSELDAGEESLRKARRQLGVYRQSLLKQAFEGKLTAAWREQNPQLLESPEELLARIQAEREARYEQQLKEWEAAFNEWEANGEKGKKPTKPRAPKDSDPIAKAELRHLPDLPAGWTYARLSEAIVNIDAGKSFSCDEHPPSAAEIGVAKVSAVSWGEYDEVESKTCRDTSKIVPEYFIKPGDFLLSRANTIELVGTVVIVKRTTKNVMLSDKTLRVNFAGIEPGYVLQYLRCRTGRLEIMVRSSGNQESMRNIGQDRVGAVITPLCSLAEQQEIVRLLDEQFTVIEQNEREIDTALKRSEALRQAILKKAFSGQLVAQDPADEPAGVLLERIRKEREKGLQSRKPVEKARSPIRMRRDH